MKAARIAVVAAMLLISGSLQAQIARPGDATDAKPPTVANPGSSIPFPYTAATEPPREPYRRPVPCATYARGTDGATTCIGIEDRSRSAEPRSSTSQVRRRAPTASAKAGRQIAPTPRYVAQRPTDPRFDQPAPDFVRQPRRDNGFLAFIGGLFSR